jgi:hypothetical protein
MERRLRDVEELPQEQGSALLGLEDAHEAETELRLLEVEEDQAA